MTTTTKCSKHKRPWDFVSNLIKQRIHKKYGVSDRTFTQGTKNDGMQNSEKEMIGRLLKRGMKKSLISVKSC